MVCLVRNGKKHAVSHGNHLFQQIQMQWPRWWFYGVPIAVCGVMMGHIPVTCWFLLKMTSRPSIALPEFGVQKLLSPCILPPRRCFLVWTWRCLSFRNKAASNSAKRTSLRNKKAKKSFYPSRSSETKATTNAAPIVWQSLRWFVVIIPYLSGSEVV